jgi:hypothetical protein
VKISWVVRFLQMYPRNKAKDSKFKNRKLVFSTDLSTEIVVELDNLIMARIKPFDDAQLNFRRLKSTMKFFAAFQYSYFIV